MRNITEKSTLLLLLHNKITILYPNIDIQDLLLDTEPAGIFTMYMNKEQEQHKDANIVITIKISQFNKAWVGAFSF